MNKFWAKNGVFLPANVHQVVSSKNNNKKLQFINFWQLFVSVVSWWTVNCFQIELYHSVNTKSSSLMTSTWPARQNSHIQLWKLGDKGRFKYRRHKKLAQTFSFLFLLEHILFRARWTIEVMTLKLLKWSSGLIKTRRQRRYSCLQLNLAVRFWILMAKWLFFVKAKGQSLHGRKLVSFWSYCNKVLI